MQLPHHLYKHPHGAFYFVLAVPRALQGTYGSRRLRYSLLTKDPAEAKAEAYRHTAYWLDKFQSMRGDAGMTTKPTVADLLEKSDDLKQLVVATKKGFVSQAKTREERELDIEEIGRLEEKGITPADLMQAQKPTVKVVQPKENLVPAEIFTIQDAFELWLKEIEPLREKKPKAYIVKQTAIWEFKQWLIAEARKELEEKNKTLPIKQKLKPIKLYKVGDKELLAYKHDLLNKKKLSIKTVVNKFIYLNQFFDLMKQAKHYLTDNPAKGKVKYSKKDKDTDTEENKHLKFEEDELQKIFHPKNFLTIDQPHLFWGLLFGLFTGARASEIAQLKISDLNKEAGSFHIRKTSPDQSLKTPQSRRELPLHPTLIKVGLFDYVQDLKGLKKEIGENWKLFPNLHRTYNGYGDKLVKSFIAYLNKLKLKQYKKSFHSFRTTANQKLSDGKVDWRHQFRFLGHDVNAINFKNYDGEFTPEELKDCLAFLDFKLDKSIRYKRGQFNAYIVEAVEDRQRRLEAKAATKKRLEEFKTQEQRREGK